MSISVNRVLIHSMLTARRFCETIIGMSRVPRDLHRSVTSTFALLIVSVFAARVRSAEPCPIVHPVAAGDTLRELADFYYGDRRFDSAILLATNSRGREGFPFIADVNDISKIDRVCVPAMTEAQRWRSRYETYIRAVFDMTLPEPWNTTKDLVTFPRDEEITVATWIREPQLKTFRDSSGQWITTAPSEIWVTVEPRLQQFCSAYAGTHAGNHAQVTLRLEQRLGLPPASGKTKFIRIRLAHPGQEVIFRPCMYPLTATVNCPVGPPPSEVDENHKNWIYHQYYSSYGQSRLSSFPWTSLGYTFDWAPAEHAEADTDFQKRGESEFVIRKGAPIEILAALDTMDYCK